MISTAGCPQAGQRGFVLPTVFTALVFLTIIALGALATAGDESRAARAMRESTLAFYAAEAGLQAALGGWDSLSSEIAALAPGDSLVMDWQTLAGGTAYRAVVQRFDNGGQPIYGLRAYGRGPGPRPAQRSLSLNMTSTSDAPLMLGSCCHSALTIRGDVEISGDGLIDGADVVPPGWDDACPDPGANRPGIITDDTSRVDIINGAVRGDPPIVQDTTISDYAFDQYGDLTWDELRNRSDHVLDATSRELVLNGESGDAIGPRYKLDLDTGETVCDTSHPYNWGSDVPGDPCFDYFPIILIKGEVELHHGYGQAVVIIDWDDTKPAGQKGGEFELETNFEFSGIILGKGCVEIQKGAQFHGAVFVNADYRNEDLCNRDADYDMNGNSPEVHWSSCVVNRALRGSSLSDAVQVDRSFATPLPARAFAEDIN